MRRAAKARQASAANASRGPAGSLLLTRQLVPLLSASAPARIVNVGSLGQVPFVPEEAEFEAGYNGVDAYRRSKLALAAFTFDLADELAAAESR